MSKYDIVVSRINPRFHNRFRYVVTVYFGDSKNDDRLDSSWTLTLWGARREAKKIIAKYERPKEEIKVVAEYTYEHPNLLTTEEQ